MVPRESKLDEYGWPAFLTMRSRISGMDPAADTPTRLAAVWKTSLGRLEPTETVRELMRSKRVTSSRTSCFVSPPWNPYEPVRLLTVSSVLLHVAHHAESMPWGHSSISHTFLEGASRIFDGRAWDADRLPTGRRVSTSADASRLAPVSTHYRLGRAVGSCCYGRLRFTSGSFRYLAGCPATLLHRAGCPRGRTGLTRPRAGKSMGRDAAPEGCSNAPGQEHSDER